MGNYEHKYIDNMEYYGFEYDIRSAMAAFLVWIGTSKVFWDSRKESGISKANAPIDIFDRMVIRSIRPFYIPIVVIGGQYVATWSADIVKFYYETKTVPYTSSERINGEYRTVTKYREVREKKEQISYASGPYNDKYIVRLLFCNGCTELARKLVLNTSLIGLPRSIDQGFYSVYALQPYNDVSSSTYELLDEIDKCAQTSIRLHLRPKGDEIRNLRISIDDRNVQYVTVKFMPVYQILYDYFGTTYECCIDGREKKQVNGDCPNGDSESEAIEKKETKLNRRKAVRTLLFVAAAAFAVYHSIKNSSWEMFKVYGCAILSVFWFLGIFLNLSERKLMKRKLKRGLIIKERMEKALVKNGFNLGMLTDILPKEEHVSNNETTDTRNWSEIKASLCALASLFAAIGAFYFGA